MIYNRDYAMLLRTGRIKKINIKGYYVPAFVLIGSILGCGILVLVSVLF
jgi:hypothetical protein